VDNTSVGIDMMPYFAAVAAFSFALSFTTFTLPAYRAGDLLERRRNSSPTIDNRELAPTIEDPRRDPERIS